MNDKQVHEVAFWKGLVSKLGRDRFLDLRYSDWLDKTQFFQEYLQVQKGKGIDVGSGPVSIFEFSGLKDITAIDPLMDEYKGLVRFPDSEVKYLQASGEDIPFPDQSFDFALCVNVIDHTPDPQKMANEIYRILKPGGILYFEVNFDDYLSPCHYDIWNRDTVYKIMSKFKLKQFDQVRNNADNQSLFHAIYEKL